MLPKVLLRPKSSMIVRRRSSKAKDRLGATAETPLDPGYLLGTRPNVYPPVAEEVAQWHFDRRMLFAIPENLDDQPTPFVGMYRHPHVLNRTGPLNLRQSRHAVRGNIDARRHLPFLA